MKKLLAALTVICLMACNNGGIEKGKFTVTGEFKNSPDQKVYLEELFFSNKKPELLDTAQIKNGKFSISASAPEEGMYRLRMEKGESGFIFINDKPTISFTGEVNDLSLSGTSFSSPANDQLKKFIISLDLQKKAMLADKQSLGQLSGTAKDSVNQSLANKQAQFNLFIKAFIDSTSSPVLALFALGYAQNIDPAEMKQPVRNLAGRFPNHKAVITIVGQFNQMIKTYEDKKTGPAQPGNMAPDMTMNDVNGNPISLSSLRGKFVLVDFWASWCGPCREENPNVVAAYNKYKDKNFTVLGVSLDDDKSKWLKAIADDHLAWTQISDLGRWSSAAVSLFGFDGIPYNVLIDPTGKIIANSLRGQALEAKLAEVLTPVSTK